MIAYAIAGATLLAILLRPFRIGEAGWAVGGALLLLLFGALSPIGAWAAVLRGGDVYLFLIGMMVLAGILRVEGAFERLAAHALHASRGSQTRLFALVFATGVGVTVFFSNDATVVVLTPAVATMLARTRVSPYPYLFACAFVANAASFVLPISNPANLVLYGGALPRLGAWLAAFSLPSLFAVALTCLVLAIGHRSRLSVALTLDAEAVALGAPGRGERVAVAACAVAALGMVSASFFGLPLGLATFGLAAAALAAVACVDGQAFPSVARGLDYGILPLVAGLFVIVAALDRAGGLSLVRAGFAHAAALGVPAGSLALGSALALASNAINNLPVALGAASALDAHAAPALRHAALVAIDLGPNAAVSGSLATLLWVAALRRAGLAMGPLRFLRSGLAVTLPALLAALLAVR